MVADAQSSTLRVGRYEMYGEIAAGGMATVYYGRFVGPLGFGKAVAIKRLHAHLAKDADCVSMFMDEVRLAARVHHPNVVSMLDVVLHEGEPFLVMEYIVGEALSRLMRTAREEEEPIEPRIAAGIVCGLLHGLHAAHEALGERGEPLDIVHRDVSPQNILVGAEGVPRLIDFGVAKAAGRMQTTAEGTIKGKVAYMSPEQIRSEELDRRTDVYAAGVILWELLTGRRLVSGDNPVATLRQALELQIDRPSVVRPDLPPSLDAVVMKALSRDRENRYATARQMAVALESSMPVASPVDIGDWVKGLASRVLTERKRVVSDIEAGTAVSPPGALSFEAMEAFTRSEAAAPPSEEATSPRKRRRWVVAAASVLLLVVGAAGLTRARGTPRAEAATGPVEAPPSAVAIESSPPPATSAPLIVPDQAPAPAASSTSPSSGAVAAKPARVPRAAPAAVPARSGRATPPVADAGCKVVQYTDERGFLRFRCAQ